MYVVSINKKGSAVLNKDAAKLTEHIKKLDEKTLLYVVLMYDYYSPLRRFEESERVRRAAAQVYGSQEPKTLKKKATLLAIEEYRGLQYDERYEQEHMYQDKLAHINEKIRGEEDTTKLKNLMSVSSSIRKELEDIEKELNIQEEYNANAKIEGGGELSFLEKMMQNKKRYQRVTELRKMTADV